MARTRTFIGIDIGEAIRARAAALQKELARTGAEVKWVAPASMHVTLVFLGDVDDRDLHGVCKAVKAAAANESPFRLAVRGVGAFPNARRPKVLWGGISDGAEPLQRLHAALEGGLSGLGFRAEDRDYTPHLTFGRVASPEAGFAVAAELPKRASWDGGFATVEEVLVFSSTLDRDGPVYTVVGRAALARG